MLNLAERRDYYSVIFPNDLERILKKSKRLWPIEAYPDTISILTELGFPKPHKVILAYPRIMEATKKIIQDKISDCEKIGFSDSVKLIANTPSLIGYPKTTIESKVKNLGKIGFANTTKLITRYPSLLTLSEDLVQNKIDSLVGMGFNNPTKLITRQPQILGMGIDTLEKKFIFFKRVLAKSQVTAVELLEYFPMALTMAQARHSLICRYMYTYSLAFSNSLFTNLSAKIKIYITPETVSVDKKLQRYYYKYYGAA